MRKLFSLMLLLCTLFLVQTATAGNTLSVPHLKASPGETLTLPIQLTNSDGITAAQFTLTLPSDLSLDEESVSLTERSDGHTLKVKRTGNGVYLVMIYSGQNKVLKSSKGALLNACVKVNASALYGSSYSIALSDVVLSLADGTQAQVTVTNGSVTTQIVADGLTYSVNPDGKTLTVTGYTKRPEGRLLLPVLVSVNGTVYTLTQVGSHAFAKCTGITDVLIAKSITTIGTNAFYYCTGLTELIIPASVTTMEDGAFRGLGKYLKKVTALRETPPTADLAWDTDMSDCELVVPAGSDSKYASANGWKNFNIRHEADRVVYNGIIYQMDGVNYTLTAIGYTAEPKGTLQLPSLMGIKGHEYRLTTIGEGVFEGCDGITSLLLPHTLTTIGSNAFARCSGLTSLHLPYNVTKIDDYAFVGCTGLTSVTVLRNTPPAADLAWDEDMSRATLNIPYGTRDVYAAADGWKNFYLPEETTLTHFDFDNLKYEVNEDGTTVTVVGYVNEPDGYLRIPYQILMEGTTYTVTAIADDAFYGCQGISQLLLANTIQTIGDKAFVDCMGLTELNIPESVTSIGDCAFVGCLNLKSVTVESSTPATADDAWEVDMSAVKLYVPYGAQEAYAAALGWKDFDIQQPADPNVFNYDGLIYRMDRSARTLTVVGYTIEPKGTLAIPSKMTIGGAEYKVTAIDKYVFRGCTGMKAVVLPAWLQSVGDAAFHGCGITTIDLPSTLTSIGALAFYEVRFSDVIERRFTPPVLTPDAFSFIDKTTLHVRLGAAEAYKAADIWKDFGKILEPEEPSDPTVQPNDSICYNGLIYKIDRVQKTMALAGHEIEPVGELSLPQSLIVNGTAYTLTSIGYCALDGCARITSVILPATVTLLDKGAMRGCDGLQTFTVLTATPANAADAFDTDMSKATLKVPFGSKEAYEAAEGWKKFGTIDQGADPNIITYGGLRYRKDDATRTLSLVGYTTEPNGELKPATYLNINGISYRLNSIGEEAFAACTGITHICIPGTLTEIGANAFAGCTALEAASTLATTPPTASSAFNTDLSKATLTVPEGCAEKYRAAEGWNRFGTIQEVDKSIQANGFRYIINRDGSTISLVGYYTEPVGHVLLPREAKIGNRYYPLTTIADGALSGCDKITSIKLPSTLTTIGDNAFAGCAGLTTLELPSAVTNLGTAAFAGCVGLTTVTSWNLIPPAAAEAWDEDMSSVTLRVVEISKNDYKAAEGWNRFYMPDEAVIPVPNEYVENGIIYRVDRTAKTISAVGYTQLPADGKLILLSSMTFDKEYPLTSIAEEAFFGCSTITSVYIPASVAAIGKNALRDLAPTVVVTCQGSVPAAAAEAFSEDMSQATLNVPEKTKAAYKQAEGWKKFGTIDDGTIEFLVYNNVKYFIVADNQVVVYETQNYKESVLKLPASLTYQGVKYDVIGIAENALSEGSITMVQLPGSIKSIEDGGLSSDNLRIISVIGTTPAKAAENAFGNAANKLLVTTAGDKDTYAAADVWKTFGAIVEPTITYDTSLLPKAEFVSQKYRCTNLSAVQQVIDAAKAEYSTALTSLVNILDAVVPQIENTDDAAALLGKYEAGKNAAKQRIAHANETVVNAMNEYMPDLWFVDISVGTDLTAMYAATIGITKEKANVLVVVGTTAGMLDFEDFLGQHSNYVNVDFSSATIGDFTFNGCKSIENVILPEGLKKVNEGVFTDSYEMQTLTSTAVTPPVATDASFPDIDVTTCTLYVPKGTRNSYKVAPGWCKFSKILETNEDVKINDDGSIEKDKMTFMPTPGSNEITLVYIENENDTVNVPDYVVFDNVIYVVRYIGPRAFYNNPKIKTLIIPSSVTYIYPGAVTGCHGLTRVVIPGSISQIGVGAFVDCPNLREVVFSPSSSLDVDFFYDCTDEATSMAKRFGPQVVKYDLSGYRGDHLPNYAFAGATALEEIILPSTIKWIGRYAFLDCANLKQFEVPEGVEHIDDNAFKGCTRLIKIVIRSQKLTKVIYSTTYNFVTIFGPQVTHYVFEGSFTTFSNYMFYGAVRLRWIDFCRVTTFIFDVIDRQNGIFAGLGYHTLIYLNSISTATGENVVNMSSTGNRTSVLYVIYENYDFVTPYSFVTNTARYTRQLPADGWYSLCLPFAAATPEGVRVERWQSLDIENNYINFASGEIEANKPCIFLGKEGFVTFVGTNVEIVATNDTPSDGQFVGYYVQTTPGEIEGYYALHADGSGFGIADKTAYVMPYHAVVLPVGAAGFLRIKHADNETGITAHVHTADDMTTHTLDGKTIPANHLSKGIYIRNHKKIIIK